MLRTLYSRLLFALVSLASCLWGQASIGVVHVYNAASYADAKSVGIAPRSMISIGGYGLASGTSQAQTFPLPSTLEGAQVFIGGDPAPLLYASPTQINAVVPQELVPGQSVALVVQNANLTSVPISLPVVPTQVGVFTQDGSGSGQPVVLNVHADGSASLNTPINSFDPEHDIALTFLVTGLGAFQNAPPDGSPWVAGTSATQVTLNPPTEVIGDGLAGPAIVVGLNADPRLGITLTRGVQSFAPTQYAGPAPGFAGLDQLNVEPGASLPFEGCGVPFYLNAGTSVSQQLGVSVRSGGGSCVSQSPPTSSDVIFRWERDIDYTLAGTVATDSLRVIAAYGSHLTSGSLTGPGSQLLPGPGCNGCSSTGVVQQIPVLGNSAAPMTLDLGTLLLTGASGASIPIVQQQALSTQYPLPAGTIAPRLFSIAVAANSSVGSANTSVQIPAPLTFTSLPQPGATLPAYNFQIAWQPVDPAILVSATIIIDNYSTFSANPYTGQGNITFGTTPALALYPTTSATLVITEQVAPPHHSYFRGGSLLTAFTSGGMYTRSTIYT